MASFSVRVCPVERVRPHPNADRLEIVTVGGLDVVTGKGLRKPGEMVAYIPENAVLPESILKECGLWDEEKGAGRCAGPKGDRLKAVRLRGVLSRGICYPARPEWDMGQDVALDLGIEKYQPPIPPSMDGELFAIGSEWTLNYDIENMENFPDIFDDEEPVVVTEKIHGTFTCVGLIPEEIEGHGDVVVCSKGLGAKGLAFKMDEANASNLYRRVARHFDLERVLRYSVCTPEPPAYILGETYGVQDLKYGADPSRDDGLGFRVFDVYEGKPGEGRFWNDDELEKFCAHHGLARVPVLYRGPFDRGFISILRYGMEMVSGSALNIREGVVIRPQRERYVDNLPMRRAQLKWVSDQYLTRRGKGRRKPTELQ